MVNTRISNIYRTSSFSLSVSLNSCFTKVRIPNRMSDRTCSERTFDPLLEVTLPRYVKQVARCPQEDDCQMSEVRSKNLLVKTFFSNTIMTFKIVRCSDRIPDPTGCRVLCESLAKLRKFRCHFYFNFSIKIKPVYPIAP